MLLWPQADLCLSITIAFDFNADALAEDTQQLLVIGAEVTGLVVKQAVYRCHTGIAVECGKPAVRVGVMLGKKIGRAHV